MHFENCSLKIDIFRIGPQKNIFAELLPKKLLPQKKSFQNFSFKKNFFPSNDKK